MMLFLFVKAEGIPSIKEAIIKHKFRDTARHSEIVDELARKICKDLKIPFVR